MQSMLMDAGAAPGEGTAPYLTFVIAGETYAVDVLRVREIIRYDAVTTVPTAPAHVRGVINLRGAVVPVVDVAVRFGLAPTPVGKRTCIVLVEVNLAGERTVMGALAESVEQVIDLAPGDVVPPPAFGTGVRVDHLVGMARQGDGFALMLDVDRVFSGEGVLQAVSAAALQPAA